MNGDCKAAKHGIQFGCYSEEAHAARFEEDGNGEAEIRKSEDQNLCRTDHVEEQGRDEAYSEYDFDE